MPIRKIPKNYRYINGINNTATAFPQTDLLETEMSFENVQPFDDLDDLS